jgi:hypothetical protein
MPRFSRIATALAALTLVAPGTAMAGSLLSGYSHPGGGEQQILGPGLLPAKHGSGSIRAQTHATPTPAVTPAVTPSVSTPAPRPSPTPAHHHAAPVAHHTTPATSTATQPTIAPQTPYTSTKPDHILALAVSYPGQSAGSGAGSPLSGSGILLVLVAILGIAGVALATRRAAEHPSD